jgi:predicted double-glycine peptidase
MKVACIHAASTIALVVAALSVLVPALAAAKGRDVEPVRSLLELRQDKVVVQKWDLSCGAAVSTKSAAP